MPDLQTLMILAVIFLASMVGSTLGFGLGLVAMPLLALFVDIKTATPLVTMVGTTIAFFIFINNWRQVSFQSIWRMILSSIIGIPVGLYALKGVDDIIMKVILAFMIIGFSVYSLFGKFDLTLKTEKASYLAGFLSGAIGSAYNMGGPPVIIYGTLRKWSPASFRATLNSYFFPICLFIVAGHYFGGLVTAPVIRTYLYSVPILIFSTLVGGMLNRTIPAGRFNRYIHIFLILIGVLLLSKTLSV